jgi:hypothetical protein
LRTFNTKEFKDSIADLKLVRIQARATVLDKKRKNVQFGYGNAIFDFTTDVHATGEATISPECSSERTKVLNFSFLWVFSAFLNPDLQHLYLS